MSETRPCEFCGKPVTKTATQNSQRKYWTCGRSCSVSLAHQRGKSPYSWKDNPYRGQKETRPCVNCGKEITRYLTQKRVTQDWTCSHKCSSIWKPRGGGGKPRTGDTVNCVVCGKEFYRQPFYIKEDRRLCSRKCNAAWQARNQSENACVQCGKTFVVKPSQKHIKYCSKPCEALHRTKRPIFRFHNGRPVIENYQGYLTIYEPTHPNANRIGRVLEHRFVMSQQLGRALESYEHVNHINHVKNDNRPENLEIMDASTHGRETNAFTSKKRRTESDELAEYRRRFGKLE